MLVTVISILSVQREDFNVVPMDILLPMVTDTAIVSKKSKFFHICVMKAILNSIVYNSNGTCSQLQTIAFNSHQCCYTDDESCTDILLSDTNLNNLKSAPKVLMWFGHT